MIPKIYIKVLLVIMILMTGCERVTLSSCVEIPDTKSIAPLSSMRVTPQLVKMYLNGYKFVSDTKADDIIIEPVIHETDTVMYLINYPKGGWELLSADKRIPTRLMVGETGSMTVSDIEGHPGMSILLDEMRHQIRSVMHSDQIEPVTDKGILWDNIDANNSETKSDGILWNLYETEIVYIDSIDTRHLTHTHWGQDEYNHRWFNRYVPFKDSSKNNNSDGRCPTGCTIVAAAQILAYLSNKYNVNTTCTFLECICNTFIPKDSTSVKYGTFTPNVSSYISNSLYWQYIRGLRGSLEEQDKAISTLMAYLGSLMDADYSPNGTGAGDCKIPQALTKYNVNCIHSENWDPSIAINQICNRKMPVIVAAYKEPSKSGHTWIIDGYYYCNTVINYNYMGVDPQTHQVVYKTIQTVGETEEFFTMNWGGFGSGDIEQYCVDSSSWLVNGTMPYTYNKRMVYNFSCN